MQQQISVVALFACGEDDVIAESATAATYEAAVARVKSQAVVDGYDSETCHVIAHVSGDPQTAIDGLNSLLP